MLSPNANNPNNKLLKLKENTWQTHSIEEAEAGGGPVEEESSRRGGDWRLLLLRVCEESRGGWKFAMEVIVDWRGLGWSC